MSTHWGGTPGGLGLVFNRTQSPLSFGPSGSNHFEGGGCERAPRTVANQSANLHLMKEKTSNKAGF